MKICTVSIFIIIEIFTNIDSIFSQTENEDQVKYYQMEPLDYGMTTYAKASVVKTEDRWHKMEKGNPEGMKYL